MALKLNETNLVHQAIETVPVKDGMLLYVNSIRYISHSCYLL